MARGNVRDEDHNEVVKKEAWKLSRGRKIKPVETTFCTTFSKEEENGKKSREQGERKKRKWLVEL